MTEFVAFRSDFAPDDAIIATAMLANAALPSDAEQRIDESASAMIEAIRSKSSGLGGVEELLREYSLSTPEGLALMVLAEALLCGVPVITLGTPERDNGQLEIVGHDWGGLVVASVAAMVEAMRRMEDPVSRQRYAVQGAAEIVTNFSVESLMPIAMDVAGLVAEGLPREALRRRLLSRPGLCTDVRDEDVEALLRACIGHYGFRRRALMRLVNNPYLYRLYNLAMVKSL